MKIRKSVYWKTISNPRIIVHTVFLVALPNEMDVFLVALPNEMDHSASFAIVRALRNGMGSISALLHSKHRNCLGSNNTPPRSCRPPALCKSTPYSMIFCYQLVNRPFLGQGEEEGYFVKSMKSIFSKTISKPPHTCAYYFSGGATPTR